MFLFQTPIGKSYELRDTLGSGSFAVVKRAVSITTGEVFAVKIIDKKALGGEQEALESEIAILQKVKHPNIIFLKEIFDTPKKMYLVMELVSGGELFDRIISKGHYTEQDAANLICKILGAIQYLHGLGIIHRDLKPENLLYSNDLEDAEIKIADFGLAKLVGTRNESMFTTCGTPGYIAPEILLAEGYGPEVDIWSVGVILYILLCGFPPFYEESTPALFEMIIRGEYSFPDPFWTDVSETAKDLIRRIFVVTPSKRFTIEQCLAHPFLAGSASSAHLASVSTKLREWHARRKFKAAIASVVATKRLGALAAMMKSKSSDTP